MSYLLRLACVCLAAFFLVNFVVGLLVLWSSRAAARASERLRPAAGARLILTLRLLPVTVALVAVAAFCIPSYLRFEKDVSESIGMLCLGLGLAGLVMVGTSLVRVAKGLVSSARVARAHEAGMRPIFALVGFVRPRVIVSQGVRQVLSEPQMEAAMLHEAAHERAHDNLKRLAIIAAPGMVPFGSTFRRLEARWARLAEWAADDWAIGTEPMRAVALAEALVRVARVANLAGDFPALSAFVGSQRDLGERVERLLTEPAVRPSANGLPNAKVGGLVAALAVGLGVAASAHFDLLYGVHCAMERLVH